MWGPGRKRHGQRRSPRRDATLARPRLLNRLPDDRRRGGERESSPAPKRQKFSCSNVCVLGVHSIKMHTFSQKELSPPHSINAAPLAPPQSSAGPPPTQVIATHPTTKPLKPLCQFMSAWKVIPGISRWLLSVIERGYTLQFRRRPPRFNGVVQSLTSPRNAQSGFYSRYFVVPKRDGGLRPILDLRPINRALCKRPFRMITLKQILAQIRPGDWFASVDLKDAYFHIQIAPHHRWFLRFAFEGTAYQYSVLPSIFKVRGCSTFPPQGERDAHPQLSGRLADFSSVPGHATQPYRLAAYSLGVPRAMCKQAKEHPRPESVHYISGSLHGLPENESLPLARTRGGHFVLPAPFQRRQLCSSEEISEAAGAHGVSFGSMSSGLITHANTAAMAEISSPLDSMDFGTLTRVSRSPAATSKLWRRGATRISSAGESPWVWWLHAWWSQQTHRRSAGERCARECQLRDGGRNLRSDGT